MERMDAADPRKVFLESSRKSKRLSARLLQPMSANTSQPAPFTHQQPQGFPSAPSTSPAFSSPFPASTDTGSAFTSQFNLGQDGRAQKAVQTNASNFFRQGAQMQPPAGVPAMPTAAAATDPSVKPSVPFGLSPQQGSSMPSLSFGFASSPGAASSPSTPLGFGGTVDTSAAPPTLQQQQQQQQQSFKLGSGPSPQAGTDPGTSRPDASAPFGSPDQTAAGGNRSRTSSPGPASAQQLFPSHQPGSQEVSLTGSKTCRMWRLCHSHIFHWKYHLLTLWDVSPLCSWSCAFVLVIGERHVVSLGGLIGSRLDR